jgi:hypothetical protein
MIIMIPLKKCNSIHLFKVTARCITIKWNNIKVLRRTQLLYPLLIRDVYLGSQIQGQKDSIPGSQIRICVKELNTNPGSFKIMTSIVGYNEFDFFLENKEYRPFDGYKIEILDTFTK